MTKREFAYRIGYLAKQSLNEEQVRRVVLSAALSLVLAVFLYRGVLFMSGIPEYGDFLFRLDADWSRSGYLHTWDFYTSKDNAPYLGFYSWFSWLMNVGSIEISVRLLLIVSFVYMSMVSFHVTFAFAKRTFEKNISCYTASIIASIASTMNPWFMIRISHYPYQWMAATAFLILYFVDRAISERRKKGVVKYALALSIPFALGAILFYNMVYLTAFLIFTLFLNLLTSSVEAKARLLNSILFLAVLTFASISLLSYYIFPLWLGGLGQAYTAGAAWIPRQTLTQASQTWQNVEVTNVFRLASFWSIGIEYYLSLGSLWPIWVLSTLVLPIVAFLAIYLKPKERFVQIVTILAAAVVLLASGPKGPLKHLYLWLMDRNDLFYHILHDPDRFVGFLVVSYAILGGIVVGEILDKRNRVKVRGVKIPWAWRKIPVKLNKKMQGMMSVFLLALLMCGSTLVGAYPLLTGNFEGYLQPLEIPPEYLNANDWLKAQEGEFRVMWLPPSTLISWASQPFPLVPSLPLWISSVPVLFPGGEPFDKVLSNLILDVLKRNATHNLGKILNLANVRFVLYHNDTLDGYEFASVLTNLHMQLDMSLVYQEKEIYIFENKRWDQRSYIYAVNKTLIVVGGLNALLSLLDIESFDPSEFGMVFLEQRPIPIDLLAKIMDFDSIVLMYGNKDFDDLLLDTIGENYYFSPYAHISRSQIGWYTDTAYSWAGLQALLEDQPTGRQEFDLNKGFIWTYFEGEPYKLDFTMDVSQDGNYQIWARVMMSRAGGRISFQLDEEEPSKIDTVSGPLGFKWIKIYEVSLREGTHKLSIINEIGQNIINLLAIVPSSHIMQHTENIKELLAEKSVKIMWVRDKPTFTYEYELAYEDETGYYEGLVTEGGSFVGDRLVVCEKPVRWEVADGVLHSIAGSPWFRFHYPENLTISDGVIEVQLMVDNNGTAAYIGFRAQNISNLYIFGFTAFNNFFELSKFVDGTQYRLFRFDHPIEVGKWYNLKVELKGDRISLYVDNKLVKDIKDDTLTDGKVGFWVYNLDAYLADLRILKGKLKFTIPTLPVKSSYVVAIHLQNAESAPLPITVGDQQIIANRAGDWLYTESINTIPGQNVEVATSTKAIDKIIIYSSKAGLDEFLRSSKPAYIDSIERLDLTEFLIETNTSNPFLLVFLEKYNNLWEGTIGNVAMQKLIISSAYNGFLISKENQGSLQLRFTPEGFLRIGVLTSALSLILILFLIVLLEPKLQESLKRTVRSLKYRLQSRNVGKEVAFVKLPCKDFFTFAQN